MGPKNLAAQSYRLHAMIHSKNYNRCEKPASAANIEQWSISSKNKLFSNNNILQDGVMISLDIFIKSILSDTKDRQYKRRRHPRHPNFR